MATKKGGSVKGSDSVLLTAANLTGGAEVTGVLPHTNGGLGTAAGATGDLFYRDTSTTVAARGAGVAGQRLGISGGLPVWENEAGAALASDNTAIASTSLSAVANLQPSLLANSVYVVEWDLDLTIATTTETFGVSVAGPSGATGNYDVVTTSGAPNTGAATVKMAGNALGSAVVSGQFGASGSATALVPVRVRATIRTGATAGAAVLSLNGSTTGNIVVKANSSVVAVKIG